MERGSQEVAGKRRLPGAAAHCSAVAATTHEPPAGKPGGLRLAHRTAYACPAMDTGTIITIVVCVFFGLMALGGVLEWVDILRGRHSGGDSHYGGNPGGPAGPGS